MSHKLHELGENLPALRVVRLDDMRLELYLATPAHLPEPFIGTADQTVWILDADADLLPAAEAAAVPAPYPSLVTVGHGLDDAHVLVDLDETLALAITGASRTDSAGILACMALELATSSWANDLHVTLVGCCPELPAAVGNGRLTYAHDVEHVLRILEHRAAAVAEILADAGVDDVSHARSRRVAVDVYTPEIVLLAQPLTPAEAQRLEAVLAGLPRVGIAAVTATDNDPIGEWALVLGDEPGVARLEPIGVALRTQQVDTTIYGHIVDILHNADDPGVEPGPHWASDAPTVEPTLPQLAAVTPTSTPSLLTEIQPAFDDDLSGDHELHDDLVHVDDLVHSADVDDHNGDEPVIDLSDAVSRILGSASAHTPPAAAPLREAPPTNDDTTNDTADDTADRVIDLTEAEDHPAPAAPQDETKATPADADIHQLTRRAPKLRFFGSVDIINVPARDRPQLIQIAAYIYLNAGSDRHSLMEAIWPGRPTKDTTRWARLSNLRTWLGNAPDGASYFAFMKDAENTYVLHPDITSDWDELQTLVADGIQVTSTANLVAALSLVRGRPFANAGAKSYAWAESFTQRMICDIVDVADELCARALLSGDYRTARSAAATGLLTDPGNERLWRARIKAEWQAGDSIALTQAIDQLMDISEELGGDLERETTDLLADIETTKAQAL